MSITNILISSFHMMCIVGSKNMLSGHFVCLFQFFFHRFFIIRVPGTYSNLTRVQKSSKSIFSHPVLYEKGPSQKVPDQRFFLMTVIFFFCQGGTQQLRGQNFAIFCPPFPLLGQFLYPVCLSVEKKGILTPFPLILSTQLLNGTYYSLLV